MAVTALAVAAVGCRSSRPPRAADDQPPPCDQGDVLTTTVDNVTGAKDQKHSTFNGPAHGKVNADCMCVVESGMTITFWDTGSAQMDCNVKTLDSGGKATVTINLTVSDSSGNTLFNSGPFQSMKLESPNLDYHYVQDFTYPKDKFATMANVKRDVTCTVYTGP